MKRFLPSLTLLPAVLFAALLPALHAEETVSEKAQRYYDSLIKRPVPGAVFDRFYTAWPESRTLDFDSALASLDKAAAANPPAATLTKLKQLKGRLLARAGRVPDAVKVRGMRFNH